MARIEEGVYADAWREHRRRARLFWALFLGYIPAVLVFGVAIGLLTDLVPERLMVPFAIGWIVVSVIAGNRVASFRCPRCGNSYYSRAFFANSFTRKCLHCGLPKWRTTEPAPPA